LRQNVAKIRQPHSRHNFAARPPQISPAPKQKRTRTKMRKHQSVERERVRQRAREQKRASVSSKMRKHQNKNAPASVQKCENVESKCASTRSATNIGNWVRVCREPSGHHSGHHRRLTAGRCLFRHADKLHASRTIKRPNAHAFQGSRSAKPGGAPKRKRPRVSGAVFFETAQRTSVVRRRIARCLSNTVHLSTKWSTCKP